MHAVADNRAAKAHGMLRSAQEQANLEDIARFFAGFELMGNPVTMVKEVSTWRQAAASVRQPWTSPRRGIAYRSHSSSAVRLRLSSFAERLTCSHSRPGVFQLTQPVSVHTLGRTIKSHA